LQTASYQQTRKHCNTAQLTVVSVQQIFGFWVASADTSWIRHRTEPMMKCMEFVHSKIIISINLCCIKWIWLLASLQLTHSAYASRVRSCLMYGRKTRPLQVEC